MKWEKQIKPPSTLCPKSYCFHWNRQGTFSAPGFYETVQSAIQEAQEVAEGTCGYTFGVCIRLQDTNIQEGTRNDYYEPHELLLEKAGLPWFYFISHPSQVTSEVRAAYIQDSEILWGKEHWKDIAPPHQLPYILCDFNAAGWSGEPDDNYYYVFRQVDLAQANIREGMKAFIYMYENIEMTEVVGFEATFEHYRDGWRAKPDTDTLYSGPVFW